MASLSTTGKTNVWSAYLDFKKRQYPTHLEILLDPI